MNERITTYQALTEPGYANAQDGLVILDGPDGLACTLTVAAAKETARQLSQAAELAEQQLADGGSHDDETDL